MYHKLLPIYQALPQSDVFMYYSSYVYLHDLPAVEGSTYVYLQDTGFSVYAVHRFD